MSQVSVSQSAGESGQYQSVKQVGQVNVSQSAGGSGQQQRGPTTSGPQENRSASKLDSSTGLFTNVFIRVFMPGIGPGSGGV